MNRALLLKRWKFLEIVFWIGLVGILPLAGGFSMEFLAPGNGGGWLVFIGVLCILPLIIYATILPLWHWKARYKGEHSDLWGALMLIETSGWFRLIYIFRHIWPDVYKKGRYRWQDEESTLAI